MTVTWEKVMERAQKAAIRFARSGRETLAPHHHVLAMEIEGVVVILARGHYAKRLGELVERHLADVGAEPFKVEHPSQERLDRLVPPRVAS